MGANSNQLTMIVNAYTRHLVKHPLSDQEITEGLTYIRDMVSRVLDEPADAEVLHLFQHDEVSA